MQHKHLSRILAVILLSLGLCSISLAGVPNTINYQGRLTGTDGSPVPDRDYGLEFKIYDASTAGAELWSSGTKWVTVSNGLFSTELGSSIPIPETLTNYDSLWLGVKVEANPENSPRTKLVSSVFSYKALRAEKADTAVFSLDKTVDAGELTEGTLDTERFSAYSDLTNEDRIGTGSDQLAAGDHSHQINGLSYFEDTTYYEQTISSTDGEVILKTVTLAEEEIVGGYIQITFITKNGGDLEVRINGNDGGTLFSSGVYRLPTIRMLKRYDTNWSFTYTNEFHSIASNGITLGNTDLVIEFVASTDAPSTFFSIGTVHIEYSK